MSATEGNPGMNHLARTLNAQMERHQDGALTPDFGEILADYSLRTNTYPVPIPKGDWQVLESLTLGDAGEKLTETHVKLDGTHSHGGCGVGGGHGDGAHDHDVKIPAKLRKLKPGDRVLVNWVQNDAVVIGRIVSSGGL